MMREAMIKDLDEVAALEAICFPVKEAADKETLAQRIQQFPASFLVMEQKGKIIAMINGCISNQQTISDALYAREGAHDPQGCYQMIFGLDVHPNYRRQGLAKQLMQELIRKSMQQGRAGLALTCKQELISFYEGLGYRHLGISESVHGEAVWHDMLLEFTGKNTKK